MHAATAAGPELEADRRVHARLDDDPRAARMLGVFPDLISLIALLAIGVVVPLVLGSISGAVLIPHNDDPAMRRVALGLFETGRLELNGWTSMTLIGQVVFVQPFLWATGGGPWAFAAATAVLTVLGIVTGYLLARRLLSVPRATLALLGVLVFPGFLLNTTSFMTDVPAWSASIICLALGATVLNRSGIRRWAWFVASMAVGCFAFSIRDFTIAAPVAVLVAAAASEPRSRRRYWLAGGIVVVVCAAIYLVCVKLPGRYEPRLQGITIEDIRGLGQGLATLSLVLSPALVLAVASWRSHWRIVDCMIGGGVGLLLFGGSIASLVGTGHWPQMIVGNLLEASGSLGPGALAGGRPVLFPAPTWGMLNAWALIAAIALLGVCGGVVGAYARRVRRSLRDGLGHRAFGIRVGPTWGMVAVFALVYGAAVGSWSLVVIMFDRYLWLLMLPTYMLLLTQPDPVGDAFETPGRAEVPSLDRAPSRSMPNLPSVVSGLLLAGLAATSFILLLNADAFEAARWRLGEFAVARGIPADTVDAGLEWVAFHASGVATPYAIAPAGWSRYDAWWPPFHLCAMASASPLHERGFEPMVADRTAYRLLLFAGPSEPLYLYRVPGPGCPP